MPLGVVGHMNSNLFLNERVLHRFRLFFLTDLWDSLDDIIRSQLPDLTNSEVSCFELFFTLSIWEVATKSIVSFGSVCNYWFFMSTSRSELRIPCVIKINITFYSPKSIDQACEFAFTECHVNSIMMLAAVTCFF